MSLIAPRAAIGLALTSIAAPVWADAGAAASEPFRTPRTEVRLVAEERSVQPGEPFRLGLHFRLREHWHVYWKNPGDSGTAPTIEWSLPDGWTAGEFEWPYPRRIPADPFVSFGYEGEVVLPVRIEPRPDPGGAAPERLRVEARARWLVCKEDCVPERATFTLELPVAAAAPQASSWARQFAETDARIPVELPGTNAIVADAGDGTLRVEITHPSDLDLNGAEIDFFPATPATVEHGAKIRIEAGEQRIVLTLARSTFATGTITALDGVLVVRSREPRGAGTVALEVRARPAPVAPVGEAAAARPDIPAALGLAFLGGLLLNLMPCVFPVISIKVLGMLGHGHDRAAGRRHGLLFAAGIVVSFWILAGLLLALRAAGQSVGWGFQLQSPLILGILSLLFFAIGLNFLGVFEVGTWLVGRAAAAGRHGGGSGAFLNGMLATLIATPCTAPFMGTAVGFALLVAPFVAMLVFTALGLGMAAPYLVLVLLPGALRVLPRPGRWMETLKQLMAFPTFATVIWLLWVLSAQTGSAGVLAVLVALLLVGLAAWTAGRFVENTQRPRRVLARTTVAFLAAAAIWLVVPSGAQAPPVAAAGATDTTGLDWIEWSPETIDRLRAEGRPTYVDFTARWCLTCQVNKKVVFGSDEVRRTFAERDIALVRADWTLQDARITEALAAFGRSGVPLNVYYPSGRGSEPRVLPTVLSPRLVLEVVGSP